MLVYMLERCGLVTNYDIKRWLPCVAAFCALYYRCTYSSVTFLLIHRDFFQGSMMYYFCKEEYKNDFAKYKQLGIHAPNSEIKKYASPADVRNLKKAIYMVPKAKVSAAYSISALLAVNQSSLQSIGIACSESVLMAVYWRSPYTISLR